MCAPDITQLILYIAVLDIAEYWSKCDVKCQCSSFGLLIDATTTSKGSATTPWFMLQSMVDTMYVYCTIMYSYGWCNVKKHIMVDTMLPENKMCLSHWG